MASQIIQGGFAERNAAPATRQRPAGIPDPEVVTERDWVAVQVGPSATGGMAVLEELRGWWVGNEYAHCKPPFRTRILVNDPRRGGFSSAFDNSEWPTSEGAEKQ